MDNRNLDGITWTQNNGYWKNGTYGYQHVYVYEKYTGCKVPKGYCIHHLDEDKNNNTIENLKCLTHSQHNYLHTIGKKYSIKAKQNMSLARRLERPRSSNTTGYKGVGVRKDRNNYVAYISSTEKRLFLGYFTTPEDAARAYDVKALELWGEEAYLNFKE